MIGGADGCKKLYGMKSQNVRIKWIFYTHPMVVISWFNQMQYAKYVVFYFVVSARLISFFSSILFAVPAYIAYYVCVCVCVIQCCFVFHSSLNCVVFFLHSNNVILFVLHTKDTQVVTKIRAINYQRARAQIEWPKKIDNDFILFAYSSLWLFFFLPSATLFLHFRIILFHFH